MRERRVINEGRTKPSKIETRNLGAVNRGEGAAPSLALTISFARPILKLGLGRFRWSLVLLVVFLPSCHGYGKIDAEKDATSMMLINGFLSPDGREAVFSDQIDSLGVWDESSRKLRRGHLPAGTAGNPFWGPDSRQFAIPVYAIVQPHQDQLLFGNVADLSIEERLTLPFFPERICLFETDVVGFCGPALMGNGSGPFTLYRVENGRLVATATLKHPAGSYDVCDAARVTNKLGLVLMGHFPDDVRTRDGAVKQSGAPGVRSLGPVETIGNTKEVLELCLFDVVSGRIVNRVPVPTYPWPGPLICYGDKRVSGSRPTRTFSFFRRTRLSHFRPG